MASDEAPRLRLLRRGPDALTAAELLAVLLEGRGRRQALSCSRRLLGLVGSLSGLAGLDAELVKEEGFGEARASTVLAAVEMARRLARDEIPTYLPLTQPEAIVRYIRLRFGTLDQEVAGALFQDN